MCGIFGHIGHISQQVAARCTDAMAHRGPDGSGLWQDDDVALGHRRLAILDLSAQAKQPMSYADGRYWITFNGEIYNFLEIRNDLEKKGHRFTSDSDTEVVLASFAQWGEQCLQRFNGMWAFAIWDRQNKSLFLSRDRFGKKPLFYAQVPTGFAFASEMKGLFPVLPEVQPNTELVRDASRIFLYESTGECVISGIKRFPAGHYGWLKNGSLSLSRWWRTLDHVPVMPSRYEDQVEQFRELFLDACKLRMRSDVPIGTALSGGLDSSSTISAMAHLARTSEGQRMSRDWQHAFVACFPGTPLDESMYARKVTDHLGINAIFLEVDPLTVLDRLPEYLYLFEDLYITSPIPFMLTYGAMRQHGVKVTIDGHGADELFGGYTFDYLHALRDAGTNLRKIRGILDTYYDSQPKGSVQFRLPPRWFFWLKWHGGQIKRRVLRRNVSAGCDDGDARWKRLDALNRILYNSVHTNVLPTLLRNYDRYSMANGVEIRMPFMDHRVVTFAFALPWTSKIRNGYSKAVVRDAMSRFMPEEIAYRKSKIGFNSPIVDWMKGPLKAFFLDTIASASFRGSSLIRADRVAKEVRHVIETENVPFHMGERAWSDMMPYLWEEAVLKRRVPCS